MRPAPLHHTYTEAEFAALVRASDKRLELWNGYVVDMSYSSPAHRDIVRNLAEVLRRKLKRPCAAYTGEPVRPPKTTGVFREPDLVVICGGRKTQTIYDLELTVNPAAIIEVTSPDTERRDRNEKLDEYRRILSLHDYLIISQKSANVTQWTKQGDLWRESASVGLPAVITLNLTPKITLALKDIYQGIKFK